MDRSSAYYQAAPVPVEDLVRALRLMRTMAVSLIYPKPRTTTPCTGAGHQI